MKKGTTKKTKTAATVEAVAETKPAAPLSLLGKILAGGANLKSVAQDVKAANEVLTNTDAVGIFVQDILEADMMASLKLGFTQFRDAEARWFGKTFGEVKTQLLAWAGDKNDHAKAVLESLSAFEAGRVEMVVSLWRLVVEIVRPAEKVESYTEFGELLKGLAKLGYANANPDGRRGEGFVQMGNTSYAPATDGAKTVWKWIVDAEARLKDGRKESLTKLEAKATLTPAQAKAGKDGLIFVRVGRNGGALLSVQTTGKQMFARVVEAVGMKKGTGELMSCKLAGKWPDPRLFQAFHTLING